MGYVSPSNEKLHAPNSGLITETPDQARRRRRRRRVRNTFGDIGQAVFDPGGMFWGPGDSVGEGFKNFGAAIFDPSGALFGRQWDPMGLMGGGGMPGGGAPGGGDMSGGMQQSPYYYGPPPGMGGGLQGGMYGGMGGPAMMSPGSQFPQFGGNPYYPQGMQAPAQQMPQQGGGGGGLFGGLLNGILPGGGGGGGLLSGLLGGGGGGGGILGGLF